MIKTQIQLPDWLYREAKRVAREREVSFAEVVRRGIEYVARAYPSPEGDSKQWRIPEAEHLGDFKASAEDWRLLANEDGRAECSR